MVAWLTESLVCDALGEETAQRVLKAYKLLIAPSHTLPYPNHKQTPKGRPCVRTGLCFMLNKG